LKSILYKKSLTFLWGFFSLRCIDAVGARLQTRAIKARAMVE